MTHAPLTLEDAFESHRAHLVRVAYGTLGSVAEAEDAVQEAWLRLQRLEDPSTIRDLRAWLTTTVSRIALDVLGSARSRREQYVGPWLPEPLVEDLAAEDPADRVTLDESVGMALMVVLEQLSPPERTAFVLHDVFGVGFDEVAEVVGRSPDAARQLASRARRRVREERPRFQTTRAEQLAVVQAFAEAAAGGDVEGLLAVLDPDVVWRSDGGGKVWASRRPQRGAAKVAKAMAYFRSRGAGTGRIAEVNGGPGLVVVDGDDVLTVMAFCVHEGRITALDVVRNPDKLKHVR
ncbi:RNA polymerase sigma factor SigJ [Conexibacter sp. SYSU D00693]|uniref:RNA polymerase sigma factor SigJ n=1 Tax=Conexibacter sp. SYSU D00693 TaxID=2812560 RepID=UPI00196AF767|nr:RNA polymerase sigma factor SigJ [Conexibacter sp. SYSU D00693]